MQMTCSIVFFPVGGVYVAKEIVLLLLKQGLDFEVAKMGTKLHEQTDEYYDYLHLYLSVKLCCLDTSHLQMAPSTVHHIYLKGIH
jgi:hypothetical protein